MKKKIFQTLIGMAMMAIPSLCIVSCGQTTGEKRLSQVNDSIQMADSIEKVERETRQQLNLDSLRTDSLIRERVPKLKNFIKVAPEYGGVKFNDFSKISKVLKNEGYDEITNKRQIPGYYDDAVMEYVEGRTETDYVWTNDSLVNIKIVTSGGEGKITFTFGDDHSQKIFMESVKSAGFKKGSGNNDVVDPGAAKGTVYHHPKGSYVCGVWLDETPGKCVLHYVWTN
ncbi:MAG: hypothetical protein K2N05_05940 [Muribaculaceae bacterium]|nr:hypothetical protein [Muribaculaceae bacterium]